MRQEQYTPQIEQEPQEREFAGILVERVEPESPAALAGLRVGDIIERINGRLVSSDQGSVAKQFQRHESFFEFTLLSKKKPRTLKIHPEIQKEGGRPRCGFLYNAHLFVEKTDSEGKKILQERLKGAYHQADGKPLCHYTIDVEQTPTSYIYRNEQREGRLVKAIQIQANQTPLDLLKRFNPHGVPIVLAAKDAPDDLGGIHQFDANQIVISAIEVPLYVHILLHELTHAEQNRDQSWAPYLDTYHLSSFISDKQKLWQGSFRERVNQLEALYPELVEGIDLQAPTTQIEKIIEGSRKFLHELGDLERKFDDANFWPYAHSLQILKAQLEETREKLEMMEIGSSEELPSNERALLIQEWKKLGWKMDFEKMKTLRDFYFLVDVFSAGSRRMDILEQKEDKENKKIFQCIRVKRSDIIFEWSVTVSEKEKYEMSARLDKIEEDHKKASTSLEKAYGQAAAVEARPGVTLFDLLCYPRWAVERDAERGALTNLRKIRKETGIDFFQPLSRLSQKDREWFALAQDEEYLKTLPEENFLRMKKIAETIEKLQKRPVKIVDRVQWYMQRIGATSGAIRKIKTAGTPKAA